MSEGSRTDDGDITLFKQRETSQMSSFLNEFPASANVLVVEPNFVTLRKMKNLMIKYGYQGLYFPSLILNDRLCY